MSSFTDDARAFIVNESENRPAMTIAKLGAAVDLIDALEMQLRGWQSQVAELKAQVARCEAKISTWMPIVASSQESEELPEGWHWREQWKFSAIGPGGAVCETNGGHPPWCSDAPRAVMQVVGHRACTVRSTIYANQCAKAEAEKHRIRFTEYGEWPEDGQRTHCWDGVEWQPWQYGKDNDGVWDGPDAVRWLPAPPPPEES